MLFAGIAAKFRTRQYTARTRAPSPLNKPRPVSTADRSSQTLLQISVNLSEFIVVMTYCGLAVMALTRLIKERPLRVARRQYELSLLCNRHVQATKN